MFNAKETRKEIAEISASANTIGKGTVITGDIETYGNLRIEGKLIGNIKSKSKVAQGEGSTIEGNVIAQNAEFAGHVLGSVEVTELLILKPTCTISGDIKTGKLSIEPGATFNGTCKMGAVMKEIQLQQDVQLQPAKSKTL
jgi:cytoskeletal protein CcmA (bactofilin family)